MADKSLLFVANWKMEMSINQTINYCQDNLDSLIQLSSSFGNKIVLCPTFPALGFVMVVLEHTPIMLGAQNCSEFVSGPYTGQVSAVSLAELGCKYCIIGHSECRRFNCESDESICRKARILFNAGIVPIVCIGETEDACDVALTMKILESQLEPLREYMIDVEPNECPVIIAYEPIWAIGTGRVPTTDYLKEVYDQLDSVCQSLFPISLKYQLMYGGSVSENNITQLVSLDEISGFLIGSASLDFQKFKNLISLCR